jgi:hypothetical protein
MYSDTQFLLSVLLDNTDNLTDDQVEKAVSILRTNMIDPQTSLTLDDITQFYNKLMTTSDDPILVRLWNTLMQNSDYSLIALKLMIESPIKTMVDDISSIVAWNNAVQSGNNTVFSLKNIEQCCYLSRTIANKIGLTSGYETKHNNRITEDVSLVSFEDGIRRINDYLTGCPNWSIIRNLDWSNMGITGDFFSFGLLETPQRSGLTFNDANQILYKNSNVEFACKYPDNILFTDHVKKTIGLLDKTLGAKGRTVTVINKITVFYRGADTDGTQYRDEIDTYLASLGDLYPIDKATKKRNDYQYNYVADDDWVNNIETLPDYTEDLNESGFAVKINVQIMYQNAKLIRSLIFYNVQETDLITFIVNNNVECTQGLFTGTEFLLTPRALVSYASGNITTTKVNIANMISYVNWGYAVRYEISNTDNNEVDPRVEYNIHFHITNDNSV